MTADKQFISNLQATMPASHPEVDASACGAETVEAWLQRFGVRYNLVPALPLRRVNVEKSRANQARPTPLVEDSVKRYGDAYAGKQTLPPIVAYIHGNQFVIIDGNNRDAGARKAGLHHLPAFVVHSETPSETVLAMMVNANSHHGVTPPLEWRLKQAQFLVGVGHPIEKAASYAAVSPYQMREHQRLVRSDQRAKALRVAGFGELSREARLSLGSLTLDAVFSQAARVAAETAMTAGETRAFVREIKAETSEDTQLVHVGTVGEQRRLEARQQEALGKRQIRSAKQGLITGLGKLLHADVDDIARQVVTDSERRELCRRLELAADKILELQVALDGGA